MICARNIGNTIVLKHYGNTTYIFFQFCRATNRSDIGDINPQNSVLKWLKHGFLDFVISLTVSLTVLWIVSSIHHGENMIKPVENIQTITNNFHNEISKLKNHIDKLKTNQEIKTLQMQALKSDLQLEVAQIENRLDIEMDNLKKILQQLQEEIPNEKTTVVTTLKIKEPNFK